MREKTCLDFLCERFKVNRNNKNICDCQKNMFAIFSRLILTGDSGVMVSHEGKL